MILVQTVKTRTAGTAVGEKIQHGLPLERSGSSHACEQHRLSVYYGQDNSGEAQSMAIDNVANELPGLKIRIVPIGLAVADFGFGRPEAI